MSVLLDVKNLRTVFRTEAGQVNAVDGVTFHVNEQEIVGVVGESGSGKSVTQLSVMQLIPDPPGRITGGEVWFEGQDILRHGRKSREMRALRGRKIGMIFQEPMTSLNPVMTIGDQLAESMQLHLGLDRHAALRRAVELLALVGIPAPESRVSDYPHQFSGGMRQRAMIAMGLSCEPRLLIADEPTTALDVTTQATLLELMRRLVRQMNSSMVLVTHNLGVVARYCDRVYVMYAGRIVEAGPTRQIFANPRHPYTVGLLRSMPRLDQPRHEKLIPIEGLPPNLINMPRTCAFLPRCRFAGPACHQLDAPRLAECAPGHSAACHVNIEEARHVAAQ